jgi:hypothetical protein
MFHYLYKTTNLVTNKIYIGAHSTNDINDGYMGSGIQLKHAIKKYGIENFSIEILEYFDSREAVFQKEFEIVTEEFIKDENNYNMCPGGLGSTIKTQKWKNQVSKKLQGRVFTEEHSKKKSLAQTGKKNHRFGKSNPNNPKLFGQDNGMFGKRHSEETKKLMSQNRKLSQINYTPELKESLSKACKGKLWYNNGLINKRFKEGGQPNGYIKGRIVPPKGHGT